MDAFVLGVGHAFGLKSCLCGPDASLALVLDEVTGSKGGARIRFEGNLDGSDFEEKFEANFRVPEVKRIFCIGVEFRPLGRCKAGDDKCGGCEVTRDWLLGRETVMYVSTILEPITFSKNAWELSGKNGGIESDDEGPDITLLVKQLLVEEVAEFVRARCARKD